MVCSLHSYVKYFYSQLARFLQTCSFHSYVKYFWHGSCKGLTLHSYVKYIGSTNFACCGIQRSPCVGPYVRSPNSCGVKGNLEGWSFEPACISKVRALPACSSYVHSYGTCEKPLLFLSFLDYHNRYVILFSDNRVSPHRTGVLRVCYLFREWVRTTLSPVA